MIGLNYIAGHWQGAISEETFEDRNPANTNELIGLFPRSDGQDIDQAVTAARDAFPAWKALSRIRRAEYLDAFAQLVKRDTDTLAPIVALESGKPINEARADVVEGLHMVQFLAGRARMSNGDILASEIPEKESLALRKPKGVVACITPWNFPFAIPLWLAGSAIAEGNTVVFKPAEETPFSGHRIAELFAEAGLPAGVLNLVQGDGEEAGWPLVNHPDVEVVLFTGSAAVGSRVRQACAAAPHKMAVCEMGGKNAMIVFDDARMDVAVNAAVMSAFKTSGQRCVSASRILVQKGVLQEFTDRFVEAVGHINIGDPMHQDTLMGPLITEAAVKKTLRYNKLAKKDGAEVLIDGKRLATNGHSGGHFVSPFVYRMDADNPSRCLKEEVFGPHVAIIAFETIEDAIQIYNDTEYGFSLAVITEDYRTARRVRDECDHGVGYVNLPTIGAEVHLPFGGVKASGSGMPSASALIDAVTHRTSWTTNYGEEIKLAQGLSATMN